MTLYEIVPALSKLEELADQDETMIEYLDGAKMTFNEKLENIVKVDRQIDFGIGMLEAEIKRLTELRKLYDNKRKNLKLYLTRNLKPYMDDKGLKEIKTDIAKLSFRKSTQLEITNDEEVPAEYKTIKQTIQIDKMKIKKDLSEGKEVGGVKLKEFDNLIIK